MAEASPVVARGGAREVSERTHSPWVGALRTGLGVLGLGMGLHAATAAAFGELHRSLEQAARFQYGELWMIAYTLGALRYESRAAPLELAALRPHLRGPAARLEALETRFLQPSRAGLALAVAAGLVVATALYVAATRATPGGAFEAMWVGHRTWILILTPVLFVALAVTAYRALARARVLSELGRAHVRVDLADRAALAPFGRLGLRSAGFWMLGSAMASLLMIDATVTWNVAVVLPVTVGIGLISLWLPVRGAHHALAGAKRQELAWIRDAIARARDALADPGRPGAAEETARLPALLAYETRVEETSEWPFDAATRVRFGLLLLVAVGSWLGGALVERLLGLVLD